MVKSIRLSCTATAADLDVTIHVVPCSATFYAYMLMMALSMIGLQRREARALAVCASASYFFLARGFSELLLCRRSHAVAARQTVQQQHQLLMISISTFLRGSSCLTHHCDPVSYHLGDCSLRCGDRHATPAARTPAGESSGTRTGLATPQVRSIECSNSEQDGDPQGQPVVLIRQSKVVGVGSLDATGNRS